VHNGAKPGMLGELGPGVALKFDRTGDPGQRRHRRGTERRQSEAWPVSQ
jgi:hypothetical protein